MGFSFRVLQESVAPYRLQKHVELHNEHARGQVPDASLHQQVWMLVKSHKAGIQKVDSW